MTDGLFGSASRPISSSTWVKGRIAARLKRREDECTLILARAYIAVAKKLNGDVRETFRLFDEFTGTVAKAPVPQRRRGKADRELDARILAAGDAAPNGRKKSAIAEAAGADTLEQMDAARRRYNRLRSERDAQKKWLAELVAAVQGKMRRELGLVSRRPLFESVEPPSPSPSSVEGTNT